MEIMEGDGEEEESTEDMDMVGMKAGWTMGWMVGWVEAGWVGWNWWRCDGYQHDALYGNEVQKMYDGELRDGSSSPGKGSSSS